MHRERDVVASLARRGGRATSSRHRIELVHGSAVLRGSAHRRGVRRPQGTDRDAPGPVILDRHRLRAQPRARPSRWTTRASTTATPSSPWAGCPGRLGGDRRGRHRLRVRLHLRRAGHRGDADRRPRRGCCPSSTPRSPTASACRCSASACGCASATASRGSRRRRTAVALALDAGRPLERRRGAGRRRPARRHRGARARGARACRWATAGTSTVNEHYQTDAAAHLRGG